MRRHVESEVHIVIGYLQLRQASEDPNGEAARLRTQGADVVRVEEDLGGADPAKPMLWAICDFIGPGDELIAPNLRHLGDTVEAVLEIVRRLRGRGAHLRLLEPAASTAEPSGRALVRALEQLGAAERVSRPRLPRKAPRRVDPGRIRALRAEGVGPSEIALRLGVSRMTVWRALSQVPEEPPAAEPGRVAVGADG